MATASASGLDGIVVADTRLSDVDGAAGKLVLAGHDVEALAGRATFEDVWALLQDGKLPSPERAAEVQRELGAARVRAAAQLPDGAMRHADGMDALRHAVASMPSAGSSPADIAAMVAVAAAGFVRTRGGGSLLRPDPALSHAADFLRLARGTAASPAQIAGLDAYLVTVSDHGLNASTFAARVVASTGSDDVSAVTAGIGALKGPLHGGAPGPVLDMLDAVGDPSRAEAWITAELDAGRRIMGMGHRIYRVRDPRAAVLEQAVQRLENGGSAGARLQLARAVERAADRLLRVRHPDRPLPANVEFYTAVLLEAVGLPREAFSTVFATGRVAGWLAHTAEQRREGRLIRPASRYVGPVPSA